MFPGARLPANAHYGRARAALEWTLLRAYRGGWPDRFACERWPRGCRFLRIAFASDLHAGPTTHSSLLDVAIHGLEEAAPDVLLLGGDYVFLSSDGIDEVASRIARVRAPLGRFGVFGNHDLWADDRVIGDALERVGVRMLVNEGEALPPPFEHVSICGLDDPWTGRRDPSRAAFRAARDVRIVLMHAPEALLHLGGEPFDLAVCGHTHGGHIALPGGVPIIAPGPLSRRYAHGRFDLGADRTLIVSRGVGATESPLRWNAPPDVLVIDVGPA